MKKLFWKPIYLGIVLAVAGLIGCSNPYDLPQGSSAPLTGESAGVNRSVTNAISIGSLADFQQIGNNPAYPLNGDYELTADITLPNWVPTGDENAAFSGTFDGAGYTLTLTSFFPTALSGKSYLGIFGYVAGASDTSMAALRNIKIVSSVSGTTTIAAGQAVGSLAGYTENTLIENITLSGSLAYDSPNNIYVGGVVGYAQKGTVVQNCAAGAAITVDGGTGGGLAPGMFYNFVGGIVGLFKDGVDILNCGNTGAITANCTTASSQVFCGGIAGGSYYQFTTEYQGRIQNSYSTGNITAKCPGFWSWAGGIAGCIVGDGDGSLANTTRIVRCYATGTVSVEGSAAGFPYAGGIVGYNYYGALVSQCYFQGNVLSNTDGNYTGGIAGYNSQFDGHNSRIEDCWSYGTVRGLHNAGGIVGQNQIHTYVKNCYSRARVITLDTCDKNAPSTNPGLGGIAGFNASELEDSISGCVALNAQITAADGSLLHRVVGNDTTHTLSNNLGLASLIPTTGGSYVADKGLDRPDGKDTIASPPTQAEYEAIGWNFRTSTPPVWAWDSAGYPRLQWQATPIPPNPPPPPPPVPPAVI